MEWRRTIQRKTFNYSGFAMANSWVKREVCQCPAAKPNRNTPDVKRMGFYYSFHEGEKTPQTSVWEGVPQWENVRKHRVLVGLVGERSTKASGSLQLGSCQRAGQFHDSVFRGCHGDFVFICSKTRFWSGPIFVSFSPCLRVIVSEVGALWSYVLQENKVAWLWASGSPVITLRSSWER